MAERNKHAETIASAVERIVHGRDAAAALAALPRGAVDGFVAVLPVWLWGPSKTQVGRKDRAPGRAQLFMPVRVEWRGGSVRVFTDPVVAEARAMSAGYSHELRTELVPALGQTKACDGAVDVPAEFFAAASGVSIRGFLTKLVEDGSLAYFEWLTLLGRKLRWMLERTHTSMSIELFGNSTMQFLDPVDIDQIADSMTLGDGGEAKPSAQRLAERCLDPGAFARVDPVRLVTVALRRDAREGLRRAVGDPKVGSRIRSVAKEIDSRDPQTVVDEYRRRHPQDRVSVTRVLKALAMWDVAPRTIPMPPSDLELIADPDVVAFQHTYFSEDVELSPCVGGDVVVTSEGEDGAGV